MKGLRKNKVAGRWVVGSSWRGRKMTDNRNPDWPWPKIYAEKIVREGGLEKAATILLDGEPEFDAKPVYQMPEKEQNNYIDCKK